MALFNVVGSFRSFKVILSAALSILLLFAVAVLRSSAPVDGVCWEGANERDASFLSLSLFVSGGAGMRCHRKESLPLQVVRSCLPKSGVRGQRGWQGRRCLLPVVCLWCVSVVCCLTYRYSCSLA